MLLASLNYNARGPASIVNECASCDTEKVATSKVYDKPALALLVGPAYF